VNTGNNNNRDDSNRSCIESRDVFKVLCAIQEVNEFMFEHDVLDIRRRELLHRKWTDRVYDPIRSHVLREMNSKDYENMLLHKRILYEDFLAQSNRKVCRYVSITRCSLSVL